MIGCDVCELFVAHYGAVRRVHARQKDAQVMMRRSRDLHITFMWDVEADQFIWTSLAEDEMFKAKIQM